MHFQKENKPNDLEKPADLVTKHVGGRAAANSLSAFTSPVVRPRLIAQGLRGDVDSALQMASSAVDPVRTDVDIMRTVLQGPSGQHCLVFICKADLWSELPGDVPRV